MNSITRVLVVDDSAYVRKIVTQMLSRCPFLEVVGTARDGKDALERVEELKPDVVTLDLIMPVLDGVGFLYEQMKRRPIPVVVCSIASESGELALEALDIGAVDFVQKPTALATDRVFEMADELIEKVKTAAETSLAHLRPTQPVVPPVPVEEFDSQGPIAFDVLTIGISTGGPQALRKIIPRLPRTLPVPVAIVLHMPVGYTELYAERLDAISHLDVREAHEGDPLVPGMVLLAPGGRHLSFVRGNDGIVRAHIDARPFDTQHRPAVDVLFQSAAEVFGVRTLAVVMTGMGRDGQLGCAHIKARGGRVLTEAEESCVVYGMPRAVIEAGLSDGSATLDDMAATILKALSMPSQPGGTATRPTTEPINV